MKYNPKAPLYLVLSVFLGVGLFAALGVITPSQPTVQFTQAAAEGELTEETTSTTVEETTTTSEATTTTEAPDPDEIIVWMNPDTGLYHDTPRSEMPEGAIPYEPEPAPFGEGDGEEPLEDPEPTTTTITEPPTTTTTVPPTTTTTRPIYQHRVIINIHPESVSGALNLICGENQWSWHASANQVIDTQNWPRYEVDVDCFINWVPFQSEDRYDFVSSGTTEVSVRL